MSVRFLAGFPTTDYRALPSDTAGPVLITAPNWQPGQCVICGGRRTWEDIVPGTPNPTCSELVCRVTMTDKDVALFAEIRAVAARKRRG